MKINGIQFDSIYESDVYIELVRRYGSKAIETHHKLLLKPETEAFNELHWAVDFKVNYKGEVLYYEAKGLMTDVFKLKMEWLEWVNPEVYRRLFVVAPNSKRLSVSRRLSLPIERVITKASIKSHSNVIL